MSSITPQIPWYVAGLAFECTECGNCCAGPEEGYVWVTEKDIQNIARLLEISVEVMMKRYVRQVGRRYSLVEVPATNDCIFLTPDKAGNRGCRIYSARPRQCRTWPFWHSNLASPEAWSIAGMRCPGINRGNLVECRKIQHLANTTRE
ncbi:MAG: YkgJ family cysteine cluster protein [Phycisphaerae bacterium]